MEIVKENVLKSLLKIRNIELKKQKVEYFSLLEKRDEFCKVVEKLDKDLEEEKKKFSFVQDSIFFSKQFYEWSVVWEEKKVEALSNLKGVQDSILKSRKKLETSNINFEIIEKKYKEVREEYERSFIKKENIEIMEMALLKAHNFFNGD